MLKIDDIDTFDDYDCIVFKENGKFVIAQHYPMRETETVGNFVEYFKRHRVLNSYVLFAYQKPDDFDKQDLALFKNKTEASAFTDNEAKLLKVVSAW